MTDQNKLRNQQQRGDRAKRLMEDELLVEAFDKLESALTDEFKESKPDQSQLREDAHKSIRLLRHLQGHLKRTISEGEVARKELLNLRDQSRVRRMFGT